MRCNAAMVTDYAAKKKIRDELIYLYHLVRTMSFFFLKKKG